MFRGKVKMHFSSSFFSIILVSLESAGLISFVLRLYNHAKGIP